jgi:hypothetical protein
MKLEIVAGGARLLTSPARDYARPTNGMRRNETNVATLALTPALCPRRGRILCRLNRKPASGLVLCQSNLRKLETLFSLPGGEGQGEGGQQTILSFTPRMSKGQR